MLSRRKHLASLIAVIGTMVGGAFVVAQDQPVKETAPGQHFRAKQVIGAKVSLDGNASVGIVDDIVIDEAGNVDYLIVVNAEKLLVTVPWDATAFDVEKRLATVHVTVDQFQKVPTYTQQQYPVFSTPAYRTQVYKYYGLTPAQERRVIRRGGATIVP